MCEIKPNDKVKLQLVLHAMSLNRTCLSPEENQLLLVLPEDTFTFSACQWSDTVCSCAAVPSAQIHKRQWLEARFSDVSTRLFLGGSFLGFV